MCPMELHLCPLSPPKPNPTPLPAKLQEICGVSQGFKNNLEAMWSYRKLPKPNPPLHPHYYHQKSVR